MKNFLFTTFYIALTALASAQDSTRINTIREVVISTSRIEKDASTEPRSITVIDAKQIAASNVKTLPELLSQQEGLYILGNGMNPGNNLSIFTRGTNANQTLLMIDGITVTDPSSPDNAFDINDITLNSIERIEIVRGANSTMYGSGAIGGSINIITKGKGEKAFEASTDFRFGSLMNISNTGIRYTDKSGIYASLGLNNISSKGIDAAADNGTQKVYGLRDKDAFQQNDIIGKLGYEGKKLNLSATVKSLQKTSDIDAGAFRNDNNYTQETLRKIYNLNATFHLNTKLDIKGNFGYSNNIRTNINDSSLVGKDTTDHTYFKTENSGNNAQGELFMVYRGDALNFSAGLGGNQEKMRNKSEFYITDYIYNFYYTSLYDNTKSNLSQTNMYAFAHADYNFRKIHLPAFNLALGFRMNQHSQYGLHPSFEISPSYSRNGNIVYASIATGFQSPSLYQLQAVDSSIMLFGNKNLKPQTSVSRELGFKLKASNSVYFTTSVYSIVTRNAIQYVNLFNKNTPQDSLTFFDFISNTYLNAGKQENNGIDLSLNIKASSQFSIGLRYSYVESKLTVNNANLDTNATHGHHVQLYEGGSFLGEEFTEIKVVRRPTNTVYAILYYQPDPQFNFRLDAHYVSARYDAFYNVAIAPSGALDASLLNGYTLMDFSAKYFITNNISLGLKIDNLMNTKYTEIIGYNTRGTTYFLDLQAKL